MSTGTRKDDSQKRELSATDPRSPDPEKRSSRRGANPLEAREPADERGSAKSGARGRNSRRASRRAAIIEGAVRVFAEKGYFNATVAEIARAAGVADGTIYLYFKSKDELLLSVFDEKMALLCGAAREAVETAASAADAIRRVAALHLEAVERNPAVASVLIVEIRQSNSFVTKADKPRLAEYLRLISDVVSQGQASGEFRPDIHPAAFKRVLFGALDEIALGWLVAQRKFDLERSAQDIGNLFVRGLLTPEGLAREDARRAEEEG